jgi:glycosyltransferase involved in cell wall biosynthesis
VTADGAALFAEPNDPESLARSLGALLDDPQLRERLGKAGRERVERELSWEHSSRALLAAYRHALGPGRSPRG